MILKKFKNPSIADGSGESSQIDINGRQESVDEILTHLERVRYLAKKHDFKMLTHLIDIAILEARDLSASLSNKRAKFG